MPQKRAAEIVGGIGAHDPFCSVTQLLFCLWDDLDKTGSRRLFSFSVQSSHLVQSRVGGLNATHRSYPYYALAGARLRDCYPLHFDGYRIRN